ncbi:MAG: hypothetical protein HUJ61_08020 [Bacilli bacterium]|nr:hypothetical protein [Bacilli bacterium]
MKKGFINLTTILLSSILFSCAPSTEKLEINKIDIDLTKEEIFSNYTTTLNYSVMNNKILNQEDFVFIYYSEGCHVCTNVEPHIINYIKTYKYEFFSNEFYSDVKPLISSLLNTPEDDLGVPQILFFKDGKLHYQKSGFYKSEQNYTFIKKMFNAHIKEK